MPISHVCSACGFDTAAVRAEQHPEHAFGVVTCPVCGAASTRHRRTPGRTWRRWQRVAMTLALLFLQIGIVAVLLGVATSICLARGSMDRSDTHLPLVTATMVILPLFTGAWLTAGLRHWSRVLAWTVFTALVMLAFSLDVIVQTLVTWLSDVPLLAVPVHEWARRCETLLIMMLVALLGIPLGHGLIVLHRRVRRWRWSMRRRRQRRQRGIV